MLGVKKLCDIQKAVLQAESGQGPLHRKAPAALHLFTIEPPESPGPPSPKMQTFQDSELSAELQTAMDTRSGGSGRSQEPPTASISPHSWSQDSLERNLPEGWDQRPKQVPLGTATVFKYPAIPAKPRTSGPSGGSPHGSPALKGFSYLHSDCGSTDLSSAHNVTLTPPKKHSQSVNRYALSDGEPDDEDEEPSFPPGNLSFYATLTRKPGRSQLARLPSTPEKNVGRSQSFAVRARKKGPPPPPPKRLSSVSSTTSGELSDGGTTSPTGAVATDSPVSVRSIAASLEGRNPQGPKAEPVRQQPPSPSQTSAGPEPREASGTRRRLQSGTETERGVKSDSEDDDSKGLEGSSSPQNSSSECIPFAEEGNLTIKQRPKAPGPPRAEAVLVPPEKPAAQNLEVPEFNLKESDTVKRRHRPKDRDQEGPGSNNSRPVSPSQEEVRLRISEATLERPASPATGPPIKPPLSPKPPSLAPKPVRQSLLAAQGKME